MKGTATIRTAITAYAAAFQPEPLFSAEIPCSAK
jgi:hypothetical protein